MPHHKCDESRLDPDTAWSFVLSGDDAGLIINWGSLSHFKFWDIIVTMIIASIFWREPMEKLWILACSCQNSTNMGDTQGNPCLGNHIVSRSLSTGNLLLIIYLAQGIINNKKMATRSLLCCCSCSCSYCCCCVWCPTANKKLTKPQVDGIRLLS